MIHQFRYILKNCTFQQIQTPQKLIRFHNENRRSKSPKNLKDTLTFII